MITHFLKLSIYGLCIAIGLEGILDEYKDFHSQEKYPWEDGGGSLPYEDMLEDKVDVE